MNRDPALEVVGLAYAYPDGHQALFGIDLRVERSERVAIVGPNGAGKTTLILHLNGVIGCQHGTVAICGMPVVQENLREIRRRVGIVFQDPDDQLFMPTVRDDVAFGPANFGITGEALDERVDQALRAVAMQGTEDRVPHHLSFGQRRRVAVATVLASRPELLVLDEPTANLDPASRRELFDVLTSLDITMLVVSHDLPYALELCPRTVVLAEGRVLADGRTDEILSDPVVMAAARLELPYGFDPMFLRPRRPDPC
jgi:cobalt/nickel transport system ATP-binding protein